MPKDAARYPDCRSLRSCAKNLHGLFPCLEVRSTYQDQNQECGDSQIRKKIRALPLSHAGCVAHKNTHTQEHYLSLPITKKKLQPKSTHIFLEDPGRDLEDIRNEEVWPRRSCIFRLWPQQTPRLRSRVFLRWIAAKTVTWYNPAVGPTSASPGFQLDSSPFSVQRSWENGDSECPTSRC